MDDEIRMLVDLGHDCMKEMIRSHSKEAILAFIDVAKSLDRLGYEMQWFKSKGVIGAKRRDVSIPTINQASDNPAEKSN